MPLVLESTTLPADRAERGIERAMGGNHALVVQAPECEGGKENPGKSKANWQITSRDINENLFSWPSLPANSVTPLQRRKKKNDVQTLISMLISFYLEK